MLSADGNDIRTVTDGLAGAAGAAGYAPSIHNTQPWRWHLAGHELDLYLEPGRILTVTDPDARLAILSCGAALHHARATLAAEGWRTTVMRMPDPGDAGHLAHLHVDGQVAPTPHAVRQVRTIPLRHTDRRPVANAPVAAEDLRAIAAAVQAEGAWLHILHRDQVIDLAAAAEHAQSIEAAEPAWQAELAYWTGGARPGGTGVPDTAIPAEAAQTTVPGRDFGHPGNLAISAQHDRAATFAILYGQSDEPRDWLRAGEGLSAGWLAATERGVSVMPLSAPVEIAGTRALLRRLLSYLNHPYLVLRLGTVGSAGADPPRTPRLPADQTIERAADTT
jgi:nitroreductase